MKLNFLSNKLLTYKLVIVMVVFIVFGNTLLNSYSFNDNYVILDHPLVLRGIEAIPDIFTSNYMTQGVNDEYRPIGLSTFAIEVSIFGVNPVASHALNLLFYIITCLLVFKFLRLLFADDNYLKPLLITILFAVHPLHADVVANVKGREEILATMFSFATAVSVILFIDTKKWVYVALATLLFTCALLTKLSCLVFAGIIPLTIYYFRNVKLYVAAAVGVVMVLYFMTQRLYAESYLPGMGRQLQFHENPLILEDNFTRLLTGFYCLFFYLKQLVFPANFAFYYGFDEIPIGKISNPVIIISAVLHIALFVYALMGLRKKTRVSYIILFYFISLSMYLNVGALMPGIVGERFAFVTVLPFCMAVYFGIEYLYNKRLALKNTGGAILTTVALLGMVYATRAAVRNTDWKDHLTLYRKDVKYVKKSAKAHQVAAAGLQRLYADEKNKSKKRKMVLEAIDNYKIAVKIYPKFTFCWYEMGMIYYNDLADPRSAIKPLKEAADQDSTFFEASFYLANSYTYAKNYDEAIKYYAKTLEANKDFELGYFNMSKALWLAGDTISARRVNNRLMNINPNSDLPYINLGNFYSMRGDSINSIKNFETAVIYNPDNLQLVQNLALYYKRNGNVKKSDYYFELYDDREKLMRAAKNQQTPKYIEH